jgi:hypothetical protein
MDMCDHEPRCPSAGTAAQSAAHRCVSHPEQGWALLCNGLILFEDGGALLPTGEAVAPPVRRRATRVLADAA